MSTNGTGGDDGSFFDENEVPDSTSPFKSRKVDLPLHTANTRKLLAVIILTLLILLYAAVGAAFSFRLVTVEQVTTLIAAFSGVQTLAAAVAGFYFGAKR